MTRHLQTSGVISFGILLASDPLSHNLYMLSVEQGSFVYWKGVDGCSYGMVHMMSAA